MRSSASTIDLLTSIGKQAFYAVWMAQPYVEVTLPSTAPVLAEMQKENANKGIKNESHPVSVVFSGGNLSY